MKGYRLGAIERLDSRCFEPGRQQVVNTKSLIIYHNYHVYRVDLLRNLPMPAYNCPPVLSRQGRS